MLLRLTWISLLALTMAIAATIRPDCPSTCGNLTISYPFGIGSGCAINEFFELDCSTGDSPRAILGGDTQVYDITDSHIRISNVIKKRCGRSAEPEVTIRSLPKEFKNVTGTPYSYSDLNRFTVVGCNVFVRIGGGTRDFSAGCAAICPRDADLIGGSCSSVGCCQTSSPKGLKFYTTEILLVNFRDEAQNQSIDSCGYAFLGEDGRFVFQGSSDLSDPNFDNRIATTVPILLDWAIGNLSCAQVQSSGDYACRDNSRCVDSETGLGGYRCSCNEGYLGNPYLDPGCTDIDECADPSLNDCEKICINIPGSFICSCPEGQYGDGKRNGRGCNAYSSQFPILRVSLGIGFGFLSFVIAATWLYYIINKRKLIKLRENFFRKNGGLLLEQHFSSNEGALERTKIFTAGELEKATNNYAEDRILGKGGYGNVYKGILSDKSVVAIKKSMRMDKGQVEQFINEVVILTQVNHRNVVKLLGCCLESEVPLLVYEYISNRTLFEHIHEKITYLSWENRLRIASEAASALSYLHSSASIPIFHRDVKSSNILLDEHYTAKISDFGASRLISLDQTEVTTLVQGTLGYLDPEYFQTSQLTEKGDVYSFGVVLAELMTGKKPIDAERDEDQRGLTNYFFMSMKENRLFQIVEPQVLREGSLEQLQAVAQLVKRCLNLKGEDRPTMKEVAMELEGFRKFSRHPWVHQNVSDESVVLLSETETLDLYTVPVASDVHYTDPISSIEFSGQHSLNSYPSPMKFLNGAR